jgi:DNA-binding NtrC family response regulator
MANVLVIEKEAAICNALATRFRNEVAAESLSSVDRVKERLNDRNFDLIICDADILPTERMETFRLLEKQTRKFPQTKVIVISNSEELDDRGAAWKGFERIEPALDQAHLFSIISAAS